MKMNTFKWKPIMLAFSTLLAFALTNCKKDEVPSAVVIQSIEATGTDLTTGMSTTIDLNGATTPTDIPIDAVVTITFNKDINSATVTSTSVGLSDGTSDVATSASVDGAIVTLSANSDLQKGTNYTLFITADLKAADGGAFVEASRSFTTAGKAPGVIPQADKQVVHITFVGQVEDEFGHTILYDDVSYGTNRFGEVNSAGEFNGTTNYVGVQYASDMSNANTTVSYWIKLPSSTDYAAHIGNTTDNNIKQYVTFDIGGNNGTYHEWNRFTCCDLGYDIDVMKYFTNHLNSGSASEIAGSHIEMKNEGNPGGDKVVEIDNPNWIEDMTGEWTHIVTTWNASNHRKAFYINGVPSTVYELTPSAEYSLDDAVIDTDGIDTDPTNSRNLFLGSGVPYWATLNGDGSITPFRSDIPFAFKGEMDDFRMYNVALSDEEVMSLYNAEKPE